jgi:hypothetical protein
VLAKIVVKAGKAGSQGRKQGRVDCCQRRDDLAGCGEGGFRRGEEDEDQEEDDEDQEDDDEDQEGEGETRRKSEGGKTRTMRRRGG